MVSTRSAVLSDRKIAITATGIVRAVHTSAVNLPTSSALGLLADLATRSMGSKAELTSSVANRVDRETAYELWLYRVGQIASSLPPTPATAIFFRETMAFAKARNNAAGVEPLLVAGLNAAWPFLSPVETERAVRRTSELLRASDFASRRAGAAFDAGIRLVGVARPGCYADHDAERWLEWRAAVEDYWRSRGFAGALEHWAGGLRIGAVGGGFRVPGGRRGPGDYGLGGLNDGYDLPGGNLPGGLGGNFGVPSGRGDYGLGGFDDGYDLPGGNLPGGLGGNFGVPGGRGDYGLGGFDAGLGQLGDLYGPGPGPFSPGALPNPAEGVADADDWRIVGAGFKGLGAGALTAGAALTAVGGGALGGFFLGFGIVLMPAGYAMEKYGDIQAEKEAAAAAAATAAGKAAPPGKPETSVTIPTVKHPDAPAKPAQPKEPKEPKQPKGGGKPNPNDMPNPDDPNGGGPVSLTDDYYPAPDDPGGGGPSAAWAQLYYPNPEGGNTGGPAGVWAESADASPIQGSAVTTVVLIGPGLAAGTVRLGENLYTY